MGQFLSICLFLLSVLMLAWSPACGFKGPPLPLIAATPEQSDLVDDLKSSPIPSVSPSVSPVSKTRKKR